MVTTKVSTHPRDMKTVTLGNDDLSITEIIAVSRYGAEVLFSPEYCNRVNQSRAVIEKFLILLFFWGLVPIGFLP